MLDLEPLPGRAEHPSPQDRNSGHKGKASQPGWLFFFSTAAICQDTGSKHWSNNGEYFGRRCSNRNPGALTHECDSSQGSGYILNPTLGNTSCFDFANTFSSFLYNVFPALPEQKIQFQQHPGWDHGACLGSLLSSGCLVPAQG